MLANSLSNLLTRPIPAHTLVSADGLSFSQFKLDVAQAMHTIRTARIIPSSASRQEVVLFHTDPYYFLVWLFASWQSSLRVIVPGSAEAKFNAEKSSNSYLYLGEMPHADLSTWSEAQCVANSVQSYKNLDPNFCALIVFTSGTTGKPLKIEKKLWQLEKEIAALENSFGATITQETIYIGSTSHQHFFGLPFLLLWPICRGSPIYRRWVRNPVDWYLTVPHVFITSPAFLERAVHAAATHTPLAKATCALFCAGSPLSPEIAKETEKIWGIYPCEIYGSSETGHIAWRNHPTMPWRLQEGVQIKLSHADLDHVLEIRSPFLADDQWFRTADRAVKSGNAFKLLGRTDTILKIEDKRISTTAIEMALKETSLVHQACVLDLGRGKRAQLGLIAQLTEIGLQMLQIQTKRDFVASLKKHLHSFVDPVGIPRRWRFIDAFPLDALGKISRANLAHFFAAKQKRPIVIFRKSDTQTQSLTLDITRDLACLEGHFTYFPIVPGVAQIQWVIEFSQAYFDIQQRFVGMKQIKFQNLMLPPTLVTLNCEWHHDSSTLSFKYLGKEVLYSSGKILFN